MSAYVVDKLDIDVLVTLAMFGPAETGPDSWSPWPDRGQRQAPDSATADELGELLWQTNAENARDPDEDPPLPPYAFERVPCPITAVEGLRALSHYRYQTADLDDWGSSAAARFCDWLQGNLIRRLPGIGEAPWGWSHHDVEVRLDRAWAADAANAVDAPPVPADAQRVLAILGANNIELAPYTAVDDKLPLRLELRFPAPAYKIGHWVSANQANQGQLHVRLYADGAAATAGYRIRRVLQEEKTELHEVRQLRCLARHGRLVVELARAPEPSMFPAGRFRVTTLDQQRAALAALGDADESWSSEAPPIVATSRGTVLGGPFALGPNHSPAVMLAWDEGERQRIADLIDEPDRQRVLDVDLAENTVLLIAGIAGATGLSEATVQETAAAPDEDPEYRLNLSLNGIRPMPAIVAVIDRPPVRPTHARVSEPAGVTLNLPVR